MESLEHGGDSPTSSDTLTAELRDGQLQIVEVNAPFDDADDEVTETLQIGRDDGSKYVQVLNEDNKGLMQLDLLNLTFVRCEDGDGEETYRLVTNTEEMETEGDYITPDTLQVTVLQSGEEENDEPEAGESYVMLEGQEESTAGDSYVMIEGEDGPVFYLQSDLKQTNAVVDHVKKSQVKSQAPESTIEMLQKARALVKAKQLLRASMAPVAGRGRRRRLSLPTPDEILASPNFRLFLYACKMCHFRCNAVRELTQHRIQCHGALANKGKLRPAATLQCARCPYRGITHFQLMRHAQDNHLNSESTSSQLSATLAATTAEILVCGACGLESSDRDRFREHLREAHGAVH